MKNTVVIAIVSDTHVRPPYDDGQRAFPSDAHHNERNRAVAALVRQMAPAAILHLGDVVHPIPTLPTHREALAVARDIYGDLGAPLIVVPGNHDVGDKRSTANAPRQVQAGRDAFRSTWGPPWQAVDVGPIRVVVVDGGLVGAPGPEAEMQAEWLERELAAGHPRTFVFTHYPPFLTHPDEAEHYDNLAPAGRRWLLELCADAGVEALFSGHVHRFFLNHYRGVSCVTLPSVAFTRPEYAALRDAPPIDAEHGRDDREHLGVTRLLITDDGHRLEIARPFSAAPGPAAAPSGLGTWLRHRMGRSAELPTGDLDALTRKVARDDAVLLHLLDLGMARIRIPLADLANPDIRTRVAWLRRHGVSLSVFSGGLPTDAQAALLADTPDTEWEVVARPTDLAPLADLLASWSGPGLTIGRIGRAFDAEAGGYFSHFPREGFDPADPALDRLAGAARIAFRIAGEAEAGPQVQAAVTRAAALGVATTLHFEVPFRTEAQTQDDDALVTARVLAAADAAAAHPDAHVFIDLFRDKDRGYWCRHALVDASDVPRAAYRALKARGARAG